MNRMTPITTAAQLAHLLQSSRAVVFKHSPVCSISSHALREMERFLDHHPDTPVHLVDVIAHRAFSRELAETVGVPHQSPQVIVFKDGLPVWNASHFDVTAQALAEVAA